LGEEDLSRRATLRPEYANDDHDHRHRHDDEGEEEQADNCLLPTTRPRVSREERLTDGAGECDDHTGDARDGRASRVEVCLAIGLVLHNVPDNRHQPIERVARLLIAHVELECGSALRGPCLFDAGSEIFVRSHPHLRGAVGNPAAPRPLCAMLVGSGTPLHHHHSL
jgi:hypothetical protein